MAGGGRTEPDWYEILGVDPSAGDAEIGRAFRALARRFHPDAGAEASDNRFSDVAQAYEVLGDPGRRAEYDRNRSLIGARGIRIPVRRWAAGRTDSPVVDPSPAGDPRAGGPEVEVSVSLAESLTGTTAKVRLPAGVVCTGCAGSGRRSGGPCAACAGEGRRRRQSGSITINQICPDCAGSGSRPARTCPDCAGRGWREQARELTVRIPAGVADGTRLRLRSRSGGPAGFARVRLRGDRWLSREGRDLVLRLPLGMAEAALGTAFVASLPDGPVEIRVPPGTQPGQRLRVPGRGVPGSPRGDLVLAVELVIPDQPDPAERAALEALLAASPDPRAGWPAAVPTAPAREGPPGPGQGAGDQDTPGGTGDHHSRTSDADDRS